MAMFDHLHNNPPPPFNPLFNPLAKRATALACERMEADQVFDKYTREERAELGLYSHYYQKALKELKRGLI